MACCGAKTRSGQPCKKPALENGRCKLHGGTNPGAPKGNQNARKHGIYSDTLTVDEQGLWDDINVGSLDDDIRIAKLQLRRALMAQAKAEAGDGLDLDLESVNTFMPEVSGGEGDDGEEVGQREQPRQTTTVQRRRRGYEDIINRLLGRIGDLEAKRAEILKKQESLPDDLPPTRIEVVVRDARKPNA